MKINIRYIGKALAEHEQRSYSLSTMSTSVSPETIHLHDIISLPEFGDRWLVVLARHIDLAEPALTLYLDLHPGNPPGKVSPDNILSFSRR